MTHNEIDVLIGHFGWLLAGAQFYLGLSGAIEQSKKATAMAYGLVCSLIGAAVAISSTTMIIGILKDFDGIALQLMAIGWIGFGSGLCAAYLFLRAVFAARRERLAQEAAYRPDNQVEA